MKLSTLTTIAAVLAALFGIALLVIAGQLMSWYGVTADAPMRYVGQLFGSGLIGFAVLMWSARNITDAQGRQAVVMTGLVYTGISLVVAVIGQIGQVVNALGWLNVGIFAVLVVGFGYLQFASGSP
jgi:hypothetical protein